MIAFPTDEQRMLEATLVSMIADLGAADAGDLPLETWATMAATGLQTLALPENIGGLAGSYADMAVVMRELGKVPGDTSYFPSAVLGSSLLAKTARPEQLEALAAGLLDGTVILAPALAEPGARYDPFCVATRASARSGGFALTGLKSLVPGGALATHFIVAARVAGAKTERDGIALFLVPASIPGVQVKPYPATDGSQDADLCLQDVCLDAAARLDASAREADEIAFANDLAIAMLAAEATGAMDAVCELTVDYLKVRKQFGTSIGSFQVLQHMAVDMYMDVEQARAMTDYAIAMLDAEPEDRTMALLGAKAFLNSAAQRIGETAVQLHGAIGMTHESRVGRLFQRLTRFRLRYGDTNHCLSILAGIDRSILEI